MVNNQEMPHEKTNKYETQYTRYAVNLDKIALFCCLSLRVDEENTCIYEEPKNCINAHQRMNKLTWPMIYKFQKLYRKCNPDS